MKLLKFSLLMVCFLSISFTSMANSGHASGEKIKYTKAHKRLKLKKTEIAQIRNVLKANEVLHSGFYNYKRSKLLQKVAVVKEAIDKIKSNKIKKIFTKSQVSLGKISLELKKKQNYKHYDSFSKELISIVLKYDVGADYDIYYCPMLKMSWVQNTSSDATVYNPYASYMPQCGQRESKF